MKQLISSIATVAVLLVFLLPQPIQADEKRLDLYLGAAWFTSADSAYKTIYSDGVFAPFVNLEFTLTPRLSVWTDFTALSDKGHIEIIDEPASIRQLHLGLGLGYRLVSSSVFIVSARGGLALHRFKEDALNDSNSDSAIGFRLGLAGDYRLSPAFSLRLGLDWKSVSLSNDFRSMKLGGLQIGLSVGYALMRSEAAIKAVPSSIEETPQAQEAQSPPPPPPPQETPQPQAVEPPPQPAEVVKEAEPPVVAAAEKDDAPDLAAMEADALQTFNKKDYPAALKQFEAILEKTPDNAGLLTYQGLCQLHTKQYDAAKTSFSLSLEKDPTAIRNLYYLGLVHDNMGQYKAALEHYLRFRGQDKPDSGFKHRKWLNQRIAFLESRN